MAELPYMPVVINDEIAETADLTNEELGALTRIKWALWKAGGFLPDGKLARIARAGSRWPKIAPAVLPLLTIDGGTVSSPSVLTTLLITRERRAQRVKAVNARWQKPEPLLNSSNPLKTHDAGDTPVSPPYMQSKTKSKYTAEELDRSSAAAAGRVAAGLANTTIGAAPDSGSVEAARNEALQVHGTELLVQRVGLRTLQAQAQIARWLLHVDVESLARILAEADQHNLQGPPFVNVVDKRVAAAAAEAMFGGGLPFGPTEVKRNNGR